MRFITTISLTVAAVLLACPASAYKYQTIQYPGASQTYVTGVNSYGVVTGYYIDPTTGATFGFFEHGGKYTQVSIPNSSGTWLTGVNDSEQLCGYFHTISGGVGLDEGFELLGSKLTPFSIKKTRATYPQGINNSGQISGYADTKTLGNPVEEGFVLKSATSTSKVVISVPGQTSTWAIGISKVGDVVGFAGADLNTGTPLEGFLYAASTGTLTTVSAPNAVQTKFYGINTVGEAVGFTADASGTPTGFTYQNGAFTPFVIPGYLYAIPQAISDLGVIVGYGSPNATTVVGFIAAP